MKNLQNRKFDKKKIIEIVALSILFIVSVSYIIYFAIQTRKNRAIYDDIQRVSVEAIQQMESQSEAEEQQVTLPDVPYINFDKLHEINEDIYAYIYIPDTQISYPIVQSADDNNFYLRRTIEKEKANEGSIFTENYNSKKFTDRNTLIYGHNMSNGTMFAPLHEYEDQAYLDEHPLIYIYTEDQVQVYRIFAASEFDDRHILYNYDFSDVAGLQNFTNDVQTLGKHTLYDENVTFDNMDRIITLSTCMESRNSDSRWLILAVWETAYPLNLFQSHAEAALQE